MQENKLMGPQDLLLHEVNFRMSSEDSAILKSVCPVDFIVHPWKS